MQDGGLEGEIKHIAAQDKDLPDIWEAFCMLATIDLFDAAKVVDDVDNPYADDVLESLKQEFETVRED